MEGRTAKDHQGFEIVEYEPPPKWLSGCWSGRALIRKMGGPTIHRWSPELAALHQSVCQALGSSAPPFGKRGISKFRREYGEGHSRLFDELEYHETLMCPQEGDSIEDVKARVVGALETLEAEASGKPTKAAWASCAATIKAWQYMASGTHPASP